MRARRPLCRGCAVLGRMAWLVPAHVPSHSPARHPGTWWAPHLRGAQVKWPNKVTTRRKGRPARCETLAEILKPRV